MDSTDMPDPAVGAPEELVERCYNLAAENGFSEPCVTRSHRPFIELDGCWREHLLRFAALYREAVLAVAAPQVRERALREVAVQVACIETGVGITGTRVKGQVNAILSELHDNIETLVEETN